jgi:AAA family ATP:ADP antiporter
MATPLKAFMDIRREELPLALLMFLYFFLVITSFWVLKPLKSALFIQYYDTSGLLLAGAHFTAAQAELLAKVLNMFVALGAVVVFTWLSRRLRRQQLTYAFMGFILPAYALYTLTINEPGDLTVWSFYLYGDLFNSLMVTAFFAFLNDSVTPEAARRLYGLIVLGGVVGGAFGTLVLRVWIQQLSAAHWLWICAGMAAIILVAAWGAGRLVSRHPPQEVGRPATGGGTPEPSRSSAALEGARLVFRSPYLLAIVAIVGLYEITSQVVDFQFKAIVAHYLDGDAIGVHLSTIYALSNWVSMFVQLFVTSFIMTRFGMGTALLILPMAIAMGSAGFLALPVLWAGSLLNTADSGFAYSLNQSAKEALYVPTSKDEKYKAKAFIDMFIQRFAKVVAIGVSLAVTTWFSDFSSVRGLSLFTLLIVCVWVFAARYAGRRYRELAAEEPSSGPV